MPSTFVSFQTFPSKPPLMGNKNIGRGTVVILLFLIRGENKDRYLDMTLGFMLTLDYRMTDWVSDIVSLFNTFFPY